MKYSLKLIICCLIFLLPLSALSSDDNKEGKKLDPAEAKTLIDQNQDNLGFVVLDVRTPEEYSSGHIENAVNIDYLSENFKEEVNKLDKNNVYVLYCGSGRRAGASVDIMEQLSFKKVYNIGGVIQLQEAGLKLTTPESK